MKAKCFAVCLSLMLLPLTCCSVQADDWAIGGYGLGGSWLAPYGWNTWAYTPDFVGAPPYFSVRPPVYYRSGIIRRHVGDSPFPYAAERPRAATTTAVESVPTPALILNPYVKPKNPGNQQSYGWSNPDQQVVQNPHR
jgi:hypothetical protein